VGVEKSDAECGCEREVVIKISKTILHVREKNAAYVDGVNPHVRSAVEVVEEGDVLVIYRYGGV